MLLSSFIITFRESLEVALVVGIILGYLAKTKREKYNNVVYLAIVSGIILSILGAFLFHTFAGGFEGRSEEIFEGITMLVGAVLLTTMILWMMKQRAVSEEIRKKVDTELSRASKYGLFALVLVSVLREGIETVIFLNAASFASTESNLWGALLGILSAIVLGYLLFVESMRVDMKKFFLVTNALLILFAAGLVAHGIHEFEEAGVLSPIIEQVWDVNPAVNADGTFPVFHEKGYVGSVFVGLFGYNGNPSLLEVMAYLIYLGVVGYLWKRTEKTPA